MSLNMSMEATKEYVKLKAKHSSSYCLKNRAHRKGKEVVVEKGGCLKKNALKHMYVSEYEHGSYKRVR